MLKICCRYLLIFIFFTIMLANCTRQNPKVLIKTSLGDIVVEIYEKKAPITAANFLRYVEENRFQGATFYRTVTMDNQPNNDVKIEVIQGGIKDDSYNLYAYLLLSMKPRIKLISFIKTVSFLWQGMNRGQHLRNFSFV